MNDPVKKTILIIASIWAVSLLTCLLFYMLFLSPQQDEINSIQLQLSEKKESNQNLKSAGAAQMRERIRDELEKKLQILNNYSFNMNESGKLTYIVGKISGDFDSIDTGSFTSKRLMEGSVSKTEGFEHLSEERLNVSFTSDFEGFGRFLNNLERNRPIIFIDKFLMKPEKKESSRVSVNLYLAALVAKANEEESNPVSK